jgi:hypothetical protein
VIGAKDEVSFGIELVGANNANPTDLDVDPDGGDEFGERLDRTDDLGHKTALDA